MLTVIVSLLRVDDIRLAVTVSWAVPNTERDKREDVFFKGQFDMLLRSAYLNWGE